MSLLKPRNLLLQTFSSAFNQTIRTRSSQLRQSIRTMQIQSVTMRWGRGDNYAYVVTDDATKESLVIDPAEPEEYEVMLRQFLYS